VCDSDRTENGSNYFVEVVTKLYGLSLLFEYPVGVMFAMRSFAPMLGFLMGAWTTSVYVDLTGILAVLFKAINNL